MPGCQNRFCCTAAGMRLGRGDLGGRYGDVERMELPADARAASAPFGPGA